MKNLFFIIFNWIMRLIKNDMPDIGTFEPNANWLL